MGYMNKLTFADVVDDSIVVFFEDQSAFADWIVQKTGGGSDKVSVDLAKQQITFAPKLHKRDEVVARVHLIGSVASQPRSSLWAWANPQFADHPVSQMSARIRQFGENSEIAELTTGELPIPENVGDGVDQLGMAATKMAAVSCRISGIPTAQISGGEQQRVIMLVDAAGFFPSRPSGVTFPRMLMGPISAGWVTDHRRATQGYAQARGLGYGWGENFASITIGFPEGPVTVAFDESGRVADIQGQLADPNAADPNAHPRPPGVPPAQ